MFRYIGKFKEYVSKSRDIFLKYRYYVGEDVFERIVVGDILNEDYYSFDKLMKGNYSEKNKKLRDVPFWIKEKIDEIYNLK